ncbi:MAG: hypothetical protein ACI4SF_00815 [Oscillospiraceae bacterium]
MKKLITVLTASFLLTSCAAQTTASDSGSNVSDKHELVCSSEQNVFTMEAYCFSENDDHIIECSISNTSDDELAVNFSHSVFVCDKNDMVNPTAYGSVEEVTFLPHETKSFTFNAVNAVTDTSDELKIYGSCVLEITNITEYDCYNTIHIEPFDLSGDT